MSKRIKACGFFTDSVVSDSLRPRGLQHARLPCPSLSFSFISILFSLIFLFPTISFSFLFHLMMKILIFNDSGRWYLFLFSEQRNLTFIRIPSTPSLASSVGKMCMVFFVYLPSFVSLKVSRMYMHPYFLLFLTKEMEYWKHCLEPCFCILLYL